MKYGWTIVQTTSEVYHQYLDELDEDLRCFVDKTVVASNFFLAINIMSEEVFGGFAIDCNGELRGLFSLEKGNGKNIFKRQIKIAKSCKPKALRLNCIGEFLREFYEEFGFKVYNTARWDERLAPKNWNTKRFETPNIYYMIKEIEK